MRKAKLIKQRNWEKERADQPDKIQPRKERATIETAKEWVKAYQTTERLGPRKQFAALFS